MLTSDPASTGVDIFHATLRDLVTRNEMRS